MTALVGLHARQPQRAALGFKGAFIVTTVRFLSSAVATVAKGLLLGLHTQMACY